MVDKRKFGEKLRKLRIQSGLSLRELADKVGVDYSYLSKIENGVTLPPSEQVLFRLAEVLNTDSEELLISAGKIAKDVSSMLQKRGALRLLKTYNTISEVPKMMTKQSLRKVGRIAAPIVLVVAVMTSLILATPLPAKAVDFTFSPTNPSGTIGSPLSFSITVNIQSVDILPISSTTLLISDKAMSWTTYVNAFNNLPIPSTPNTTVGPVTVTSDSLPHNNISVSVTTGPAWGSASPGGREGWGYGYSETNDWLGWGYHSFSGNFGYGYNNGGYQGVTSITYNFTWTPPSSWPAGTYHITAVVKGDNDKSLLEATSFTLSSQPSYGGAPTPTPTETEPGTWDVSDVVTSTGEFTVNTTVTSGDDKVSLTIGSGTTGTKEDGSAISEIKVTKLEEPPAPPPTGDNIILFTYDIEAGDVTFDQEITLTMTYDDADVPEGADETDLVVWWYDEAAGEWVELPTTVDTVNNTLTVQLTHISKYAIMARVVTVEEEEEPVVPVVVEEEEEGPVVEEEEPVVEEEEAVVEEEEAVTEEEEAVVEEEEPAGGIAWWVWLIIGIAVVVVIVLVYIYWWRPRTV